MAQAHDVDPMVTLPVAAQAAGVSVSALRKWYRNGTIRSETVDGPNGPQRIVSLNDVMERASKFRALSGARELTPAEEKMDPETVSGRGLLIPRDDWAKMMSQLGNMLEMSERVTAASAEAAKERTANEFLRERLAELRERLETAEAKLAENETAHAGRRGWRRSS